MRKKMTAISEGDIREELVLANHVLANAGILDAFGHVSVRDPDDAGAFFLTRARSPGIAELSDVMRFDLEGGILEGDGKPYIERFIHAAIYKRRGDVHSVVHHHSPAVLPFAISDVPLRPVFHMGAVAGARVPVWDSQDEFGDTALLVSNMVMGESLAATLGDEPSALLARHGAVCVGADIRRAVYIAMFMRDNAQLLMQALSLGQPSYLTEGEIAALDLKKRDASVARAWECWVRQYGG
jgi:ribulose-5-phosphate 4-epimerase/fuculose-1-phosphate aldolase